MLSGDISHFCKYGRYFLIGYYLSETDKLLLLAERAKENIRFENSVDRLNKNKRDLRVSLSHKVRTYTMVATDEEPFNSVTAVLL